MRTLPTGSQPSNRTLPALLLLLAMARGGEASAEGAAEARELYQANCAACHGRDGAGMSQSLVGFSLPLPDFIDCSFATREPDSDWYAVTHGGGPARGFNRLMPAFGDALSSREIEQTLAHVRRFCADESWPRGDLNFPRALFTEKAFVEDEAVFTFAGAAEGFDLAGELVYEKRFGARSNIEIVVPFGLRRDEDSGALVEGVGDVAFGVKHVLFHSLETGTILSVAGELFVPSGDESEGFGRGTFAFEPFVAAGQSLPLGAFVQLQAGAELPFVTTRSQHELFGRLVLGRSFAEPAFGRSWTPMVELMGSRELTADAPIAWDVVPQLQLSLNQRQHVLMALGARVPVSDPGGRPVQLVVYLLWDWFDGGLTEGW